MSPSSKLFGGAFLLYCGMNVLGGLAFRNADNERDALLQEFNHQKTAGLAYEGAVDVYGVHYGKNKDGGHQFNVETSAGTVDCTMNQFMHARSVLNDNDPCNDTMTLTALCDHASGNFKSFNKPIETKALRSNKGYTHR